MSTIVEVEATDVIKLIAQYLMENGLHRSLEVLQQETSCSLNSVDDIEGFVADIHAGRWDVVLQAISSHNLPPSVLIALYEQIVLEMVELGDMNVARAILSRTPVLLSLKIDDPERYLKLEHMLQKPFFDAREAYPSGMTKERRRALIAQNLAVEVVSFPPSRLLALLGQSLKWQQYMGMVNSGGKFDIFRGSTFSGIDHVEIPPSVLSRSIRFGNKCKPEIVVFSPDGLYLVSGSSDGFIEVWDMDTGRLRKDLTYQADSDLMMHDSSVRALTFSPCSEYLASGSEDGTIKVWRVRTGECLRRFPRAHLQAITCLCFAPPEGSQLLSASLDTTLRLHGLRSTTTLKEFRGHESYVNFCSFSSNGSMIFSASSDGSIRIWDTKTSDLISSILSPRIASMPLESQATVVSVYPHPRTVDHIIVTTIGSCIYIMTTKGDIVETLNIEGNPLLKSDTIQATDVGNNKNGNPNLRTDQNNANLNDIISSVISYKGGWIYAGTESGMLLCFNCRTGKLEVVINAHSKRLESVASHPHRNLIATISPDGTLKLWKPQL